MTYDKNHALLETRIPGLPAPKHFMIIHVICT